MVEWGVGVWECGGNKVTGGQGDKGTRRQGKNCTFRISRNQHLITPHVSRTNIINLITHYAYSSRFTYRLSTVHVFYSTEHPADWHLHTGMMCP